MKGKMGSRKKKAYGALLGAALVVALATGFVLGGCGYSVARMALGTDSFSHKFGRTDEVRVVMRDGAGLNTRIHLPKGDGPWPTMLVRNPYNMADWFGRICRFFTRYGYACVHQDVRGRQGSDGEWNPLIHEREDGTDTLEWLVDQPFQDGNIALFGMSYLGMVQWAVADALPPEVKTIIPMVSSTRLDKVIYQAGMFRPEVFTMWAALMPGHDLNVGAGHVYHEATRYYPQIDIDERFFGQRLPWFRQWQMSADPSSELWTQQAFVVLQSMPSRVEVPALMMGAWFDLFTEGQLEDYRNLATRSESKLVIGPWSHLQHATGERPLPNDPGMGGEVRVILDWLDHYLKGKPLKLGTGFVETYTMEEGAWRRWESWPPETESLRFYLDSLSQGPECVPGNLAGAPSPDEVSLAYDYDPRNPVPSKGGGPLLAFAVPGFDGVKPGSVKQDKVCARPDVLSFVSEPLEEDLHIAGDASVHLFVSSSAEDTAFTAKLCEVTPKGKAYNIRDSIISLAHRSSEQAPLVYDPGEVVDVAIEMWPIEWQLKKGYRIRLDVSSSNFPAYHTHANRFGPWALQDDPIVAHQTVYVGGQYSSYLEIPVWRGSRPAEAF